MSRCQESPGAEAGHHGHRREAEMGIPVLGWTTWCFWEFFSNLLTFLSEMGFQPPSQTKLREKSIEEAGGKEEEGYSHLKEGM